jgi:hypothetical protein
MKLAGNVAQMDRKITADIDHPLETSANVHGTTGCHIPEDRKSSNKFMSKFHISIIL